MTNIPHTHETLKPDFNFLEEVSKDVEDSSDGKAVEVTGEYLLTKAPMVIAFLLEGILQRCGIACLAGPSDTGKSMLLRMLALWIATRQSHFLGYRILARHYSAIFVSTEDQENETAFLLRKQCNGFAPEALKALRFLFDQAENLVDQLDVMMTNAPADLVVIDCFSDAFGGDLKDTQKIRTYLHPFQKLAAKHDTLILFLHHTGKRTENFEPSKNNLLAGQGFEAKMRCVLELRADTINPNYRHLCIVKGNYIPANMKRESFVLEFDEDTFLFRNTGDRVPFEMLSKQPSEDNTKNKYDQARALKGQGYTLDQIAEKLGYAGKGSVSKLLAKGDNNGWSEQVSQKFPQETTRKP